MSPRASSYSPAHDAILARLRLQPQARWLPEPSRASLSVLSEGVYHSNHLLTCDGERSVLRLNRSSQWGLSAEAQLQREYVTLVDLADSGVTPHPLALIGGSPPLLVEEYIAGDRFSYSGRLQTAATAIAQVHRQPLRSARDHLPVVEPQAFLLEDGLRWLNKADRYGTESRTVQLLRQAAAQLRRTPAPTAGEPVIVHTDLTAGNLIVRGDGCAIVDWEAARHAPAAWDLAYFLSPLTTRWTGTLLSKSDKERFLVAYASAAGVEYDVQLEAVERLMPAVLFRAFAWCVGFQATADLAGDLVERLVSFTAPEFVEHALFVS